MAKDYAHKPKQPERSRIPQWVWLFTSVVAVCFVGFLFYLSHVPEESGGADAVREQLHQALNESDKQDKPQPTPQPSSSDHETLEDLKTKAEAAKKAFEFYELLENDEVSVDLPGDNPSTSKTQTQQQSASATKQPPPKAKSWIIQVASFTNVADADKVRAQLILNGLPNTEISSVNVAGKGTYHRVMVGPFDHRPELNKAQDILAELRYQPLVKAQ
ncbi:MAG: SPOR domain-containing protein [Reinekea sp.]|jgi:cell division protein FtsN